MPDNQTIFFAKKQHSALPFLLRGATRLVNLFFILGAIAISTAVADQQVARESWWDRTSKAMFVATSHRIRSDLSAKINLTTAEGIDKLWFTIDAGLGQLRPRSRGLQQALLFTSQEDLSETMRSQFAVDPPSDAFAFFSPLGQGIAICTEDVPAPFASRGLIAAIGAEYLRLSCGADLAPALQVGILDFLARRDAKGDAGGIGEAGIAVVRKSVTDGKAISMLDFISMTEEEWKLAVAQDSTGALREQSASVVRFLTQAKTAANASYFLQYLRLVSEGTPNFAAFSVMYGLRDERGWEEFDKQWKAFALKENSSANETLRERMAFLGEGLRQLDNEGALPVNFAALEVELKDRDFVSPTQWRPGFSQIRASEPNTFTPIQPYEKAAGVKPTPSRGKIPQFEFDQPKKGEEKQPPSVLTVDLPNDRSKIVWFKTRPEPEAPWVWDISR